MVYNFLIEKHLFCVIDIFELFVAGLPNAVEKSCSQTVDGEYSLALVAEVNHDKHL